MESLSHQALSFFRSKPRDERYFYHQPHNCAFAQFLKGSGKCAEPFVGDVDWDGHENGRLVRHPIPEPLIEPLRAEPHTFGQLADRLSAALTEKDG